MSPSARSPRLLLVGLTALASACASRDGRQDAPSAGPAAQPRDVGAVLGTLRAIAPHALGHGAFERATPGVAFVARAPALPVPNVTAAGARTLAPERADGVVRLEDDSHAGVWVEIEPEGLASVAAEPRDGAIAFSGAAPGVDLIYTPRTGGFEESRLVWGDDDEIRASWSVRLGSGLTALRQVGAALEAIDEAGAVRIGAAAPIAIDARKTRRAASTSLRREGDRWHVEVTLDARGLARPVVLDPVWTLQSSMSTPRRQHAMWTLTDGKVLVAGGHFDEDYRKLSSAEVFTPAANTWAATGAMKVSHGSAFALVLGGRRVLLGGDSDELGYNTTSEIYDEASKTWSNGPSTLSAYGGGGAVVIGASKAFLAGGDYSSTAAEIFDLSTGATDVSPLPRWRAREGIVQLKDGRVMLVGGAADGSVDLFDPATKTWSTGPALPVPARHPSLTQLDDGRVLLAGGDNGMATAWDMCWTWTPGATAWTSVAALGYARSQHAAIKLANGRVLVIGGVNEGNFPPDVEMFDPTTNAWSLASRLTYGRYQHAANLLADGRVIVSGGMTDFGVTSTAEVFAPLPLGSLCKADGECPSGPCIDGVCCDRACKGACERCNDPAQPGTCVATAAAPLAGHASCGAYGVCTAGACATSCTGDAQCAAGNYCKGTACVPKLAKGSVCSAARECATGFCVDGVCCDRACNGQCEACDIAGKGGSCAPAKGAPHGARAACTGAGVGTTCGIACDGVDASACHYPTATAPCSATACASGTETHASYCDGAGKCTDVAKACGAYACGTTQCNATCSKNADCAAGYWCKSGSCVARDALGVACATSDACGDGLFCTDGVCCGVPTCGPGGSCATAAKKGECRKSDGVACTAATDCGSGQCVDGVCCDAACDGQCEACDVPGKVGKCSPATGKPHGARAACADGGGDVCAAKQCDGANRTTCAAFVGTDVPCRAASCDAGTATAAAFCNGAGGCPAPAQSTCATYACDTTTRACKTHCTVDGDCATGHGCVNGACVRKTASCSASGESVVSADGVESSCAPFVCRDDKCLGACETSADCAPGLLCDDATKGCKAPAAPTESNDAGGGCSAGGRGGGASWLVLALLGAALTLRRRLAIGVAVGSIGCGHAEAPTQGPDAGAPPAAAPQGDATRAAKVMAGLRTGAVLSPRLATGATGGWSSATPIEVGLPAQADGALRVSVRGEPELWVEVVREGARPVAATKVDGAQVALDAEPDTDVVHVASREVAEEIRVVRSPKASLTARYHLSAGRGARSVSIEAGRVHVRGERVDLATDPMWAVDAKGARRALSVHWVDDAHTTFEASLDGAGLAYPIAIDPAWSAAGTTSDWHYGGFLQKLGDGTVIAVAGGNVDKLATELFEPSSDTWSSVAAPSQAHSEAAAGGLASGDLVLAGGRTLAGVCDLTTEVYRRASKTWQLRAPMPAARREPGFAMLADGRLLVAGGGDCSGGTFASTFAFNDVSNSWTTLPSMSQPRWAPTAVKLANGKVLVTGGYLWSGVQAAVSTSEIFDPVSNTWSAAAPMSMPRFHHTATVLSDGRVLVAGGERGFYLAFAEIYDPTANAWKPAASMRFKRAQHGAALLASGRVLVTDGTFGSYATNTSEAYDVARDVWLDAGTSSPQGSYPTTLQRMNDNRVLSVGIYARVFTEQALGKACATAGECGSGYCTDGVCCGTASCPTGTSCSNPTKPGSCAKLDGMTCAAGAECASGLCVDGVCCNAACTGQCEACDVAGSVGKCTPVNGQSHGARPACDDGGGNPCRKTTCNGVMRTACTLPAKGTVACGAASCTDGVESHASTCDGGGACSDVKKSCGLYVCGASACLTTCASASDCVAGYWCKAGACVPTDRLGTACVDGSSCAKGLFCTDGVCCGVASCGGGATCAAAGHLGQCSKKLGSACGVGAECASGLCVDGVCCDRACDGQCEACDASGSTGTCTAIKGAPHGGRAACAVDADKPCANAICDGTEPSRCAAFPGAELQCAGPSCADGVATAAASCDGKGACAAATKTPCAGFACDEGSRACKLGCGSKDDCLAGYVCQAGKCVTPTDECVPNGSAVAKADGGIETCSPFVCKAGSCLTQCNTTDDCEAGLVCDVEAKTCGAAPTTSSGDTGGCGAARGTAGSFGAVGAAALALALVARRRRGRR
jgi:N-acetylneuraminic acid mutarotase